MSGDRALSDPRRGKLLADHIREIGALGGRSPRLAPDPARHEMVAIHVAADEFDFRHGEIGIGADLSALFANSLHFA